MKIGPMRYRITIRNFITTRTPSGQPTEEWSDGATIWAEVKGTEGRRFRQLVRVLQFIVPSRHWQLRGVQTRRPPQKNGSHWRRSHLTVIFRPEYPLRLR